MNRQMIINAAVGGFFGFIASTLIILERPWLGIAVVAMWLVGMINSLIPKRWP